MDTDRRRFLAAGGAVLAGSLAGCLDAVTGDLAFAASPARVAPRALRETGYTEHRVEEDTLTRSVGVGGLRRRVVVTNVVAEYDQGVSLLGQRLQAAVFVALSTPAVEFFGRTFNPVADMSTAELVELVQSRYGGVTNVAHEADFEASILGQSTTVSRYRAEARLLDSDVAVDIYLHVAAAVEAGDDLVLAIAAHPRAVGPREAAVRTLLAGVEH